MKFFWRAKTEEAKPGDLMPAAIEDHSAKAIADASATSKSSETGDGTQDQQTKKNSSDDTPEPATNVVTLQPAKLTDRIAAASVKPNSPAAEDDENGLVTYTAGKELPLQRDALKLLASAIANNRDGSNVILIGPSGTGRRTAASELIEACRAKVERPRDWIYATAPGESRRLAAHAMPHGQGALFVREVKAAIGRAEANHARLVAGDDYRLGLEIIDEEFRHRCNKTLDSLKRRAEAQNIALVKTPEGFVLAPMHEGKVVRNDVFRSLPETLQREVSSKIASLEGELKAFVESLPIEDAAQGERIAAFNRDTAARAVKSQFEAVRAAFQGSDDVLDRIEASLVSAIAGGGQVHDGGPGRMRSEVAVLAAQVAADFSDGAPVVIAHDVTPGELLGELGLDADGRVKLKPGALMRANGGFLLIEAWRFAALPEAWLALSAALEAGEVKPRARDGLLADIEPLALKLKIVLVADDTAIQRLSDIDPGILRYFPHIVRFQAVVPRAVLTKSAYAEVAAALAADKSLRPLASSASGALYDVATISNNVSVNLTDLSALLYEADKLAMEGQSSSIRGEDIKLAASRIREARTP